MTLTMLSANKHKKKKKQKVIGEHQTSPAMSRLLTNQKVCLAQCILELFYTFQYFTDWIEEHHPEYYEELKPLIADVEGIETNWITTKFKRYYSGKEQMGIQFYASRHFYTQDLRDVHMKCFRYARNMASFMGVKGGWKVGVAYACEMLECLYRKMVREYETLASYQMRKELYTKETIALTLEKSKARIFLENDRLLSPLISKLIKDCGLTALQYDYLTTSESANRHTDEYVKLYEKLMSKELLNRTKDFIEQEKQFIHG